MQAAPGAELARRARNLPDTHPAAPHGIISYSATNALAGAEAMGNGHVQESGLAVE